MPLAAICSPVREQGEMLWVETNDKGLRFMLFRSYALSQHLGSVRGIFAAGQDAPYRRGADAKHGLGGAICGHHVLLGAIGVRFLPERPYLDREERRLRKGGRSDNRDLDLANAGANQTDFLRCRMRKVDHPALHERTAIDDPHIHRFIVAEIPHANNGLERQGAVSRNHGFHIVDFAIRGGASVIRMPVPTREPAFGRADIWSSRGAWRRGFRNRSGFQDWSGDYNLLFAAGSDNEREREHTHQVTVP
jgi:hypothetical protein